MKKNRPKGSARRSSGSGGRAGRAAAGRRSPPPRCPSLAARYAARRRAVLRAAARQSPVDAFLATDAADIRYLCGATEGSESLLFGEDWSVVMTRRMYRDVLPEQCPGSEVVLTDREGLNRPPQDDQEIAARLRKHRARRLGFDEGAVSLSRYRRLSAHVSERCLVPFRGLVPAVRAVKDEEEIRLTRKAVRIAEAAFRELIGRGTEFLLEKTERQLAAELEYLMRNAGADRQAFGLNGIIVASGPNSASCHHVPTERRVRPGEPLLFDWGAEVDGYRSDLTRVVFVGEVSDEFRRVYQLVDEALACATERVRPGVRNGTVDRAARALIEEAGYGEQFRHGLGHGLGLDIHEQPRLTTSPENRLRKNMIVTIEPGIYLTGRGGVRLENDILVTAWGPVNLCSLPTSLDRAILR